MRYLFLLLLLAGCQPESDNLFEFVFSSPEKLAERQHNDCISYGFEAGTDFYANCRMNLALARKQAIAQSRVENRRFMETMMASGLAEPPKTKSCTVIAMNNRVTPYRVIC